MNEYENIFQQALDQARQARIQEIGTVISVGDSLCHLTGLAGAFQYEMVEFAGGNTALVMNIGVDEVTVFLLGTQPVHEGETAIRTRRLASCWVGDQLLSRVINAQGTPLDGQGPLDTASMQLLPIERTARGIIERTPIDQPLVTGVMSIDALIPIGKGQRELLIGNRATGKTAIVMDTIVQQKNKDIICVYVGIGQRAAHSARLSHHLALHGALDYTVMVVADASESAINRYMAPYVGCTIAEYFQGQGKDVLIIYDDLSSHAIAYREMSLLMRRFPGREAYPGDVFYLHSRLLERAGRFISGGSITALPVAQIQADDITSYIATNLISITDGQIFLDTKLFHAGLLPAVNVELSVSRVGGAAQTPAMKRVVKSLRLELAQFHELAEFAQFGSDLDTASLKRLARGQAIVELFKQDEHETYDWPEQVLMLFLMRNNFLENIPLDQVRTCARGFATLVQSGYPELYQELVSTKDISPELQKQLELVAQDITKPYIQSNTND
jgi:F-type H+/Na+-transporting ATPase subunit alpha